MRLPFFYGWIIVAVVFVTMALGVNARTAFSLLLPPILGEFGWPRGVVAGAFSFGFLVSAALSPALGWLMDRRGPKVVMELGVVLMGAGLLLASYVTQPWHLYATLGVLVGGGSICLGYTGQSLFLPNWFVRRRGLALSLAFAGVGVGSIVLLPWMQAFMDRTDWRTACWTLGVVVLVVLAPLNLLLWRRPEDLGLQPDGDAQSPGATTAGPAANVVDPAWAAVDWTLARALRTSRFWWIAVAYITGLYAWYAVQVHQTKYLVEIGFSTSDAAWALGAVSLVAVPGQIALGHISDRIGREWVWTVACVGFVICYLALIAMEHLPSPALLWLMVVAQGALGYGYTSVMGAIVAEIFQGRHYGVIFGTVMLLMIGGGAAGPWLTGIIYDVAGSYAPGFWISAGLSVISAIAIWFASPRKVRAVAGQIHRIVRPKPA
ncbi:MFS transporter [Vineibacter terrae]|uniref:MFS transporter n=1 Tax=Vineibacter terrae TaxID=2586908 RepID=UPI002E319049|nr:MFS transporter [Vineibacter terrae]HEX2891113.1 MFS transporter [Vineibacter terrae]